MMMWILNRSDCMGLVHCCGDIKKITEERL
nr:MAG TPA: hypothetical protein [Caudoviricetes sp.]